MSANKIIEPLDNIIIEEDGMISNTFNKNMMSI